MNIQVFELIQLVIAIVIVLIAVKIYPKSKKVSILVVAIIPVLFFFTPVVFKQESFSKIERIQESITEQELPERVVIEKEDYSVRDKIQSKQLKSESEELLNEILN